MTTTTAAVRSISTEAKEVSTSETSLMEKCFLLTSVSAQMRFLDSEGVKRARIAKLLGKRYQHVKNVLDRPLKKAQ